ncbi:tyrosine-type recombinase/integrase [Epilithonimonas caeni]|uniref:tyrosine-type recombinase/integrase n=1 Tax=Epilithonimonas caeni TaxID=365343 RepID=UPI0003F64081|nr:tyrosine-type recombinase/integrase [Epilithonimonas caeni]
MKNLKNGCSRTEVFISPKNYKELRSKEDLKKKWFVQCIFYDPLFESKYPKGFQYRMKVNVFDNIIERKKAVEATKEEMIKGLDFHNFNPISKQYMVSESEELRPDLFLYEALTISQNTISASPHHLKQIRCAVNRMQKFIEVLRYDFIFIKDIKIWHIKNLLEKMKLTPSVYNKFRHYLMTLFRELIQYGCIDHNPVRDITKKIEATKIRKVLTKKNVNIILKYLQGNHYEFYRYTQIFFLSGARSAELLRVQRKHVDLENQEYVVLIKKGRQYIWETKVIIPEALPLWTEILNECIYEDDYVFAVFQCPGLEPVKPTTITRKWSRIVKNNKNILDENGKPIEVTEDFYSLKHLFLDILDELSDKVPVIDINLAQGAANHKSNRTTGIYAVGRKNRANEYLKNVVTEIGNVVNLEVI